ncbi:branched-chain amino acid ABC transporter permease [Bacillus sp. JJ1773]|uniref:branched-chain amino acid ABC transporter permease n=1 Tax=Bacillus sp. JJ1773 TaxID=3122965 RepID=UPI002FFFCF2C
MLTADVFIQALISGLSNGIVYALIAIGFTLVFGVMDIVNFSHGHKVMLSMFISYFLYQTFKLDPFLSLAVTIPALFIIGFVLYKLIIRHLVGKPHSTHIITTIALFIILENLMNLIFGGDLRGITTSYSTASIGLGTVAIGVAPLLAASVTLIVVISLYLFLQKSDFGKAIRACSQNLRGAQISGINTKKVYIIAFAISAALAGLAGTVMIPFKMVDPFVGHEFLSKSFAIVVLGGLGSISGAFIGAILIGIIQSLSTVLISASMANAITFALIIAVIIIKPTGLISSAKEG